MTCERSNANTYGSRAYKSFWQRFLEDIANQIQSDATIRSTRALNVGRLSFIDDRSHLIIDIYGFNA